MKFSLFGLCIAAGALTAFAFVLAQESKPAESALEAPTVAYLRKHVAFLAGLSPARNHANTASLDRAAEYISGKLRETTDRVDFQDFTVDGRSYKNVRAIYPGSSVRRIIVGAHYDVAGDQPGADDNASGVAVLIELGFRLKQNRPELPFTLELVAFSLEEPPYFRTNNMGSAIHAKSLREAGLIAELMLSLDCVGYYAESPGSQNFPVPTMSWFYPDRGNFLGVVGKTGQGDTVERVKTAIGSHSPLKVESITAPAWLSGVDFSDHLNYWKYDIPAVLVTDTALYRNRNYHRPGDTPETLDYPKMDALVNGLYGLVTEWRDTDRAK